VDSLRRPPDSVVRRSRRAAAEARVSGQFDQSGAAILASYPAYLEIGQDIGHPGWVDALLHAADRGRIPLQMICDVLERQLGALSNLAQLVAEPLCAQRRTSFVGHFTSRCARG